MIYEQAKTTSPESLTEHMFPREEDHSGAGFYHSRARSVVSVVLAQRPDVDLRDFFERAPDVVGDDYRRICAEISNVPQEISPAEVTDKETIWLNILSSVRIATARREAAPQ